MNDKQKRPARARVMRPKNSGYSEAGASYRKRAMKGFNAISGSPQNDIDVNNRTLRQRCRTLYMAAPIATSAIRTNRTNVIGTGLRLLANVDAEVTGMTPEEAAEWNKKTEREFRLWASRKQNCDAAGVNNFAALQQLALQSWLMSGDVFAVVQRRETTPMQPYGLRIQLVEADRVATPSAETVYSPLTTNGYNNDTKNVIFDGVEVDKSGMAVAYHIRSTYPEDYVSLEKTTDWIRVEAIGKETGLPQILQIMESERCGQYRGVPYLAQVIEPLLQMRRYTESELMAALVESFFTAWIKTNDDASEYPFEEVREDIPREVKGDNEYEMGPGTVHTLEQGEDIVFGDPKRPASGFSSFVRCLSEQVGAALEIPADLLLKSFNASYSASRAALLEAWKAFSMRREWFADDFCRPIYEIWMHEAVASGRIYAPGFFTDPIMRDAYLGASWVGPSQGQLDPTKEVKAEILAVENGFSTRQQSATRINGSDWNANMQQVLRENEIMAEAKAILEPEKMLSDNAEYKKDNDYDQKQNPNEL